MLPGRPAAGDRKSRISIAIATVGGVGYLRPGPGTWASAATVLGWLVLAHSWPERRRMPAALVGAAAASLVGIPAASRVSRQAKEKDPGYIVIDEVAGQLVALSGAPLKAKFLLAAFGLFRVADILKPFPLRRLERLPAGWGIVADDLGAGLYALALLRLLIHARLLGA